MTGRLSRILWNVAKKYVSRSSKRIHSYQTGKTISPVSLTNINKYSNNSYTSKCWNCNFPHASTLFCSKCKALQELPENLNYFNIMGLKEHYNVELQEIHNKYRELQRILHPDKFGYKSTKEQEISAKISSSINKAYNTLNNPLRRGIYLLKLKNISISEETTNTNPEFLMKIMELNEKIDDASNNRDQVIRLIQENKKILDKLIKELSGAFDAKDLEKARETLVAMKYYTSIETRLKILKQSLGIVD